MSKKFLSSKREALPGMPDGRWENNATRFELQPGSRRLLLCTLLVICSQALACIVAQPAFLAIGVLILTMLCWCGALRRRSKSALHALGLFFLASASVLVVRIQFPARSALCDAQNQDDLKSNKSVPVIFEGKVEDVSRHLAGEIRFIIQSNLGDEHILVKAPDLPWHAAAEVRPGDEIQIDGRIHPVSCALPNPFSYQGYLFRHGISGSGEAKEVTVLRKAGIGQTMREAFITRVLREFGNDDAVAVLLAAVLGEGSLLSRSLWDLFKETGTVHMLVVSGFHVGVIFGIIYAACRFVFGRFPRLILALPIDIPCSLVALVGVCFYTCLVGSAVTIIRAVAALSIFAVGRVLGRKTNALHTLFLAMLTVLFIWPGSFFDLGWELTFGALFGLYFVHRRLGFTEPSCLGKTWSALCHCLGAWTLTSVILLIRLSTLAPASSLINLFAMPIFSALCIAAGGVALGCYFLAVPFSAVILRLLFFLLRQFLWLLSYTNAILQGTMFAYQKLSPTAAVAMAAVLLCGFYWFLIRPPCEVETEK